MNITFNQIVSFFIIGWVSCPICQKFFDQCERRSAGSWLINSWDGFSQPTCNDCKEKTRKRNAVWFINNSTPFKDD